MRGQEGSQVAPSSSIDSLTESDLDRRAENAPVGADHLCGTFRDCLQSVADRWYMHRAQLADARPVAGIQRSRF